MKNKYILAALLFFFILVSTYYISTNENQVANAKDVFMVSELKSNCTVKKIEEETDKFSITAYYPETKYDNLNEEIKSNIDIFIFEFTKEMESASLAENGQKYKLEIKFDDYERDEYISYVFSIYTDFGGAHPNMHTYTVSYDTKNNKIIYLKDLIANNKDLLKIFSEYSFNYLNEESRIILNYQEDMLKNGTAPKIENFSRFAFDKNGLKIFFERYSVAPFVAGEFVVDIPYNLFEKVT